MTLHQTQPGTAFCDDGSSGRGGPRPRRLRYSPRALIPLSVAGFTLVTGCGATFTNENAAAKSAEVVATAPRRCANVPPDRDTLAQVLNGSAIENVTALYEPFATRGSDPQGYALAGAVIQVRPLPGMTPESLDLALECHSARQAARNEPVDRGDPFALPGKVVAVEVKSVGHAFAVSVAGVTNKDAKLVLARARELGARARADAMGTTEW
ncbi:MAG: hypothetical protein ABSC94_19125 [Polyangiaceae bacterium]